MVKKLAQFSNKKYWHSFNKHGDWCCKYVEHEKNKIDLNSFLDTKLNDCSWSYFCFVFFLIINAVNHAVSQCSCLTVSTVLVWNKLYCSVALLLFHFDTCLQMYNLIKQFIKFVSKLGAILVTFWVKKVLSIALAVSVYIEPRGSSLIEPGWSETLIPSIK